MSRTLLRRLRPALPSGTRSLLVRHRSGKVKERTYVRADEVVAVGRERSVVRVPGDAMSAAEIRADPAMGFTYPFLRRWGSRPHPLLGRCLPPEPKPQFRRCGDRVRPCTVWPRAPLLELAALLRGLGVFYYAEVRDVDLLTGEEVARSTGRWSSPVWETRQGRWYPRRPLNASTQLPRASGVRRDDKPDRMARDLVVQYWQVAFPAAVPPSLWLLVWLFRASRQSISYRPSAAGTVLDLRLPSVGQYRPLSRVRRDNWRRQWARPASRVVYFLTRTSLVVVGGCFIALGVLVCVAGVLMELRYAARSNVSRPVFLGIVLPVGGMVLILGYLVVRFSNRFKSARHGINTDPMLRCLRCGYDLRASPARCPECGTVTAQKVTT